MALLVAGCSESAMLEGINENTKEYSNLIEFSNAFVENPTRTSLGVGMSFPKGAQLSVVGVVNLSVCYRIIVEFCL